MRKVTLVLITLLALTLLSCSQLNKQVTSYEATGTLLKVTYQTVKPSCDAGALPAAKCEQMKKIYNDCRRIYILSGTVLEAIISTEDAVLKQQLLARYADLMQQYATATQELVKLLQEMGVIK